MLTDGRGTGFANWHTRIVHGLTVHDARVLHPLLRVMQMERHPISLYFPGTALWVISFALHQHQARRALELKYDVPRSARFGRMSTIDALR